MKGEFIFKAKNHGLKTLISGLLTSDLHYTDVCPGHSAEFHDMTLVLYNVRVLNFHLKVKIRL